MKYCPWWEVKPACFPLPSLAHVVLPTRCPCQPGKQSAAARAAFASFHLASAENIKRKQQPGKHVWNNFFSLSLSFFFNPPFLKQLQIHAQHTGWRRQPSVLLCRVIESFWPNGEWFPLLASKLVMGYFSPSTTSLIPAASSLTSIGARQIVLYSLTSICTSLE